MEFDECEESKRELYISEIKQEEQRSVVNVRCSTATSICSVTWTHRTTGCDVISTVTTTIPIKNGNMRDIKMYNMEMRKIKAPGRKPGLNVYVNPLEDDATGGNCRSRKHFNDILRAEKVAFMTRLHKSRHLRATTENISVVIIQRIFRGYWVRWHMDQIFRRVQAGAVLRQTMRAGAAARGVLFSSLSEHRAQYGATRSRAAIVIQCAFRCYVCRSFIRRRRWEMFLRRRHDAAVRIQCLVRARSATEKVGVLRERRVMYLRFRAAVMLQSVYRGILGKRRVRRRMFKLRWVAARMIQGAFRGRNTRKAFAIYLAAAERIKLYKAARGVQKIVRARISRARVRRMRMRRLFKRAFDSATRIQTLMRLVLCNKRVLQLMLVRQKQRDAAEALQREAQERDEEAKAQELADSIDIFVQTRLGNTVNVDSLYHHEVEAGTDVVHCTNEEGDTILSVAARYGHMDIVRKCLQWGFDVNHENASGESVIALALAAEKGHLDLVMYIMQSQPTLSTKESADAEDTFLTATGQVRCGEHDMGLVLTAAAGASDSRYLRTLLEISDCQVDTPHPVTEATALHVASEAGCLEMVQMLVKAGAKTDCVDDMGHSPLQKACCGGNVEVVKLLLGLIDGYTNDAFPANDAERSDMLLKKDSDGKDTLLLAAIRGRGAVVEFISKTADMSSRTISDEIGWAADDIECAVQLAVSGNVPCLEFLVEANFDLSWAPESSGTNMAMAACRVGQCGVLDFLLQQKADFSATDEQGKNALHYAAECTQENVIPYLLAAGSDKMANSKLSPALLTCQDSQGRSVLHIVAEYNSTLSFELVALEHMDKALSTVDSAGRSPLHIACANRYSQMIREMIRMGADATAVDNSGKNAIWHYVYSQSDRAAIDLHPECDLEVLKVLLNAGCPLFSYPHRSIEASAALYREFCAKPDISIRENVTRSLEATDLFAAASKLTLLTTLSNILNAEDEWRLGEIAV